MNREDRDGVSKTRVEEEIYLYDRAEIWFIEVEVYIAEWIEIGADRGSRV